MISNKQPHPVMLNKVKHPCGDCIVKLLTNEHGSNLAQFREILRFTQNGRRRFYVKS